MQPQAENAGAQEVARLLAKGLTDQGHDVRHLFFYRRTKSFDQDKIEFCCKRRPKNPISFVMFLARLLRAIRKARPDAVICFQHYGNVVAAPLAKIAGVELIVANQNSAPLTTPALARALDYVWGAIGVYDQIVTVSATSHSGFAHYPERYRRHITRIDHGVDVKSSSLSRSQARSRLGLPEDGVILGCAARLHILKNIGAAVRLLAVRPAWRLALAGQGPEEKNLRMLAETLGCQDRVIFLGELNGEEIATFFAALDVFVFPSAAETFGLAAAEAAQAGVPVVANALPVLNDVLAVDGKPCGRFVDVNDIDAFAAAVDEVIETPLGRELAERGRALAARYPVGLMVDAYARLLQSGLARPG